MQLYYLIIFQYIATYFFKSEFIKKKSKALNSRIAPIPKILSFSEI